MSHLVPTVQTLPASARITLAIPLDCDAPILFEKEISGNRTDPGTGCRRFHLQ